jgi:hypothetical protein
MISLERVYEAFFTYGPAIDYASGGKGSSTGNTNFMKISTAVDGAGVPRSFLATDEQFQFLKSMHARNLIVPIQADFGGPKAIRAVGDFLRARGLKVSAFYISNVEQYLFNPTIGSAAGGGRETNGGWRVFYDNLATLPPTTRRCSSECHQRHRGGTDRATYVAGWNRHNSTPRNGPPFVVSSSSLQRSTSARSPH